MSTLDSQISTDVREFPVFGVFDLSPLSALRLVEGGSGKGVLRRGRGGGGVV